MKKASAAPARILLADDNTHGLMARAVILREQGYTVETALCGEDAWELYQKSPFDLVVTDYRMGTMDGLQLIRNIRATDSPARIILLSGFAAGMGLTEASSGADEVITKGCKEVPELLRAVNRLAHQPPRRGPASVRRTSARKAAR